MSGPYKACGKQVLRDREHIADATSETYAQIIADALNGEREPVAMDDPCSFVAVDPVVYHQAARIIADATAQLEIHNVTNHIDGSRSCICGRRWDRDEGDECPGMQV